MTNELSLASDPRGKCFWVVSPNVKNTKKSVEGWMNASRDFRAAFMGWEPNNERHGRMGPKFAGVTEGKVRGIRHGDIILIARRHCGKPQIVGFGVVCGRYQARLKGFKPPLGQKFGSLRKLSPFKQWRNPQSRIPLIDVLQHTRALVQLHPEKCKAHAKVCKWMEQQLIKENRHDGGIERPTAKSRDKGASPRAEIRRTVIVDSCDNPQLDYTVRTKSEIKTAKRIEGQLLHDYRNWLKKKNRELSAARFGRLQCDAYEKERRNLIEAKSSTRREYIRMAVGQLLDYAFQGKEKFCDPNMAILLPKKPGPDVQAWLQHLKIRIIWRERELFVDNENGQFS